MKGQHFERGMLWDVFWERLGERASRTSELIDLACGQFEQIWRATAIEIGREVRVEMSVGSDGKLKGNMAGWLLFGLTGVAAFNMAINQSAEARDKAMQELKSDLEARLSAIDQRVKNIEEDIGIRKPL